MKIILCGFTLLVAGALHATPITYDYYATVSNVQGLAEPNFGGLVIGNTLTGSFTYDTAALNQGNAASAAYNMISMSVQVGALSWSLLTPSIQIDLANEYYWAAGGQNANPHFALSIVFVDTTLPYIYSDTLLRPPPDLTTVDGHYGSLDFFHGSEAVNTHLYFNLDRVVEHSSSVPDSGSTFALLAGSLGLMMFWQRKPRQKSSNAGEAVLAQEN